MELKRCHKNKKRLITFPRMYQKRTFVVQTTKSKKKYSKKLRRVAIWDDENQQVIEVITNQMSWTANTITELYKARWEVEIFFRDIKQQLHIKSFIGTSQNAVMIQIWTALITILT